MKYLKLIILLIFLLFTSTAANAATEIFKTGFESSVALNAVSGTHQEFNNGIDAVTGYHVTGDMPGAGGEPRFNIVTLGSNCEAEITSTDKHAGTYSMRIYNESIGDPASRMQLNVDSGSHDGSVNDFNRTSTKFWVKWTSFPTTGDAYHNYNLWYEWRGTGGTTEYAGRLLFIYIDSTHTYLEYFWGGTSYSSSRGERISILNSDWLNKWVEVKVFHQVGVSGRCIVDFKLSGESAVRMIDWSGDNSNAGNVYVVNPIKTYGEPDNLWLAYYDDFAWYTSTGPTDLPDWDEPIYNVSPVDGSSNNSITSIATWEYDSSIDGVELWLDTGECDGTPDGEACEPGVTECIGDTDADNTTKTYDMSTLELDTAYCLTLLAYDGAVQYEFQQFDFTTASGPPVTAENLSGIVNNAGAGQIVINTAGPSIVNSP